jgi:hypothetical protein
MNAPRQPCVTPGAQLQRLTPRQRQYAMLGAILPAASACSG